MLNNLDTNDNGDDGNNHDDLDKAMIFISPPFLLRIIYLCIFLRLSLFFLLLILMFSSFKHVAGSSIVRRG